MRDYLDDLCGPEGLPVRSPILRVAQIDAPVLLIHGDLDESVPVAQSVAMAAALRQGYATATDLADYLVKKGLPFRDAHEVVARAVRACEERDCDLADLTLDQLRAFSPLVADDVYTVLTVAGSLAARDHLGGTAPVQVRAAIARSRARL